jgi:hypothetical protein
MNPFLPTTQPQSCSASSPSGRSCSTSRELAQQFKDFVELTIDRVSIERPELLQPNVENRSCGAWSYLVKDIWRNGVESKATVDRSLCLPLRRSVVISVGSMGEQHRKDILAQILNGMALPKPLDDDPTIGPVVEENDAAIDLLQVDFHGTIMPVSGCS